MAYYLINLNYYSWKWVGLNDNWTGNFEDYQYNVLGATISARSMVMSSTVNLIVFFAKQGYQKFKFPDSVMYDTPYKVVYHQV